MLKLTSSFVRENLSPQESVSKLFPSWKIVARSVNREERMIVLKKFCYGVEWKDERV